MAEWLTAGSALLGAAGGLFGSGGQGGGRQNTSFNQTSTNQPWSGISPYLLGGTMPDGTAVPGIYPEAARLYGSTGMTPTMRTEAANFYNDVYNRRQIFNGSDAPHAGANMVNGLYDPNITAAGPINGPGGITPTTFTPAQARTTQGELDPTKAIGGFLTGESANPWADKQGKAITEQLTRNFNESVLPQIRSGAQLAGQYGSNRQALAEGTASARLAGEIAPHLTALGGSSYENEQQRKYGAAMGLNQQAVDVATGNANRALTAADINARNLIDVEKFNTGTALVNNTQAMQQAAQVVGNRGAGLDFMTGAAGLQDQNYMDILKSLNIPSDYDWANLGRYASLVGPAAQFQTTNSSGTSSTTGGGGGVSPISGAIGGAAGGLAIGNQLFGPNGIFGRGGVSPITRTSSTQTYTG